MMLGKVIPIGNQLYHITNSLDYIEVFVLGIIHIFLSVSIHEPKVSSQNLCAAFFQLCPELPIVLFISSSSIFRPGRVPQCYRNERLVPRGYCNEAASSMQPQ
jgi:hypothetical protein